MASERLLDTIKATVMAKRAADLILNIRFTCHVGRAKPARQAGISPPWKATSREPAEWEKLAEIPEAVTELLAQSAGTSHPLQLLPSGVLD
jgi:hypothetical protein